MEHKQMFRREKSEGWESAYEVLIHLVIDLFNPVYEIDLFANHEALYCELRIVPRTRRMPGVAHVLSDEGRKGIKRHH